MMLMRKSMWSKRAITAAAMMTLGAMPLYALGAKKGIDVANVAAGQARFERSGPNTTIYAADKTIINYRQFNVPSGTSVKFVQPSSASRVFNRINSPTPSRIDGTLTANGTIYLVNSAGVMFGKNSVVNVGQLIASAGSLSDASFLSGVNRFTNNVGEVVNEGTLQGEVISLVGKRVQNSGTITAEGGVVAMVAGDNVVLSEQSGGNIVVQIARNSSASAITTPGGVQQNGTVVARGAFLGAGDVYSLAVGSGSRTTARKIDIKGGAGSNVSIAGAVNASGTNAGGKVNVSGGNVTVASTGSINADAKTEGNGGVVLVRAANAAVIAGPITARGGAASGNGGYIDTSGENFISVTKTPDASARAATGSSGSWLLDPGNITIVDGSTAGAPTNGEFDGPSTITNGTIEEALNQGTRVIISTGVTRDFTITQNADASITKSAGGDATLTLFATSDITLNAPITSSVGKLNVVIRANELSAELQNERSTESMVGIATLNAIETNGGNVTVSGNAIRLAKPIAAGGGDITFVAPAVELEGFDNSFGSGTGGLMANNISFNSTAQVGGTIIASGAVTFASPVVLSSPLSITAKSARFASTIDSLEGGNILSVQTSGASRFDGAIGANKPIASFEVRSGGVITLNTPSVNTTASVKLNAFGNEKFDASGKRIVPDVATITGPPEGGDLTIVAGDEFTMGTYEKLTVIGNLSVTATKATLGDISALGDININASAINLLRRPAGRNLTSSGELANDSGLDFVSGGDNGINFNNAKITVTGIGDEITFADAFATGEPRNGFRTVQFGPVDQSLLTLAGNNSEAAQILDLGPFRPTPVVRSNPNPDPYSEPSDATVAVTVPRELRRVRQDIVVSAALRRLLVEFGVNARLLVPNEYHELLTGRALYNDVPGRTEALPEENTVAVNRLQYENVAPVAMLFKEVFYPPTSTVIGGAGGGDLSHLRIGEIKSDIGTAWEGYKRESGGAADPKGLLNYTKSKREYADAAKYLTGLQRLAGEVHTLGLTPLEVQGAQEKILVNSRPDNISPTDMRAVLALPPANSPQASAQ